VRQAAAKKATKAAAAPPKPEKKKTEDETDMSDLNPNVRIGHKGELD